MDRSRQITGLLQEWSGGDPKALAELTPLVYEELHRQAARHLRNEQDDRSLQTTALIHEAYVRLIDQSGIDWQSRKQFFAFAAQVVRHILVDHARGRAAVKSGNGGVKVSLTNAELETAENPDVDLLALNEALNRLAAIDEQQIRIVELRYFGGLSLEEAAEALKISRATAARDWNVARAWLHRELTR